MTSEQKPEPKDDIVEFRTVCRVAKSLIESGKLSVRIVYPNRVDLGVSSGDLKAAAESAGVPVPRCRAVLDGEIAPLMAAGLSGDLSILSMLAMRAADSPKDFNSARKGVEDRKSVVTEELVTERLRSRYLLKKTSKTNPLTGWHWETSAKQYDDREGALPNLRHATVRIHARRRIGRYEETESSFPFAFPLAESHSTEAFAFDCDLEEAIELRQTFDRIVRELQTPEGEPAPQAPDDEGR